MELFLLRLDSYTPKNTPLDHMFKFYRTFEETQKERFDGMIITGAPVEQMEFEKVSYWSELSDILEWKLNNVTSCIHICWGAQAALYKHHGVPKYPIDNKKFGVYPHRVMKNHVRLLRGFDDVFFVPVSRHTETRRADLEKIDQLDILVESEEAGVFLVMSKDRRQIYITGHPEYDSLTLKGEYDRDKSKGLPIDLPVNYFPRDNPDLNPEVVWRSHANLLYSNWVNYCVYQETPYDLNDLDKLRKKMEHAKTRSV
jgi:homoserine O-succinyltransferase